MPKFEEQDSKRTLSSICCYAVLLHRHPYGHKIALRDIAPGEHIMKYGECIGAASHPISKGDYVHVHNLDALRGRGDL